MCNTKECIDNICQYFFSKNYEESIKQFEHIGANTEFLAKRYKISVEDVKKNLKQNINYITKPESKTDLNGFVLRYGEEEGLKLYKERCSKISKSLLLDWYIEKYGIELGYEKYILRFSNLKDSVRGIKNSKNQFKLYNALKLKDEAWLPELWLNDKCVDMLNLNSGVVVEYFGDYWHCNPLVYDNNFYNKNLHMTAVLKQEKDRLRLNEILLENFDIKMIIVIWENSFVNLYKLNLNGIIDDIYSIVDALTGEKIVWI